MRKLFSSMMSLSFSLSLWLSFLPIFMSDQCYFGGLTVSLKASKRFLEQIYTPKHKSQFGNVRI